MCRNVALAISIKDPVWLRGPRGAYKLIQNRDLVTKALDVAPYEVKASNGWLDRFKNRNGIKAKFISGEAGDVSKTTVD